MQVRRSTGNVFRDLGFSAEEAENLRIRADLMIRLSELIEDCGLTQAQAAKLLGVTQPRVSDLVRGKIQLFSVDSLLEMLGNTGAQVSFVIKYRQKVSKTKAVKVNSWSPTEISSGSRKKYGEKAQK